MSDILL